MNRLPYKKIINLGKIDYNNVGKKVNEVIITLNLKKTNKPDEIEFTASGEIWDDCHSDCVCCGQCIDTIAEFFPTDKKVQRIKEIWEEYHLNSMHAGCKHQREFEKEPYDNHKGAHCDICNYTYGTAWIYEPIPVNIINEILSF